MSIPSLGQLALSKATRQLQEAFYKYISEIWVPDCQGTLTLNGLQTFEYLLNEGILVARWWLRYMWRVLEGDEWSEPGVQLEYFDDWVTRLEVYTSSDAVSRLQHNQSCTDIRCCKYLCTFHRSNAELSLYVYNNFLDYERNPSTGDLVNVWYLNEPFY